MEEDVEMVSPKDDELKRLIDQNCEAYIKDRKVAGDDEDGLILRDRRCFKVMFVLFEQEMLFSSLNATFSGSDDENGTNYMQIVLFYASAFMLYAGWWMMACITGYSQIYYQPILDVWRGSVPFYFWIPAIVSSFGFYIMYRFKQNPLDVGDNEERRHRTPIFLSLMLLFIGVFSATWIKIAEYDMNPHVYPCFNLTTPEIPYFNCTDYFDREFEMPLPVQRYDGGGWGVVIHNLLVCFSTLINRHARVMVG